MSNIQIIGIDFAKEDSKDYTAYTSVCTSCNNVINTKIVSRLADSIDISCLKKCPVCGAEFLVHQIVEELQ